MSYNTPEWIIDELNKSLGRKKPVRNKIDQVTIAPDCKTDFTMIENFEEITEPLTKDDETLVPVIIRGISLRSKSNPVKGSDIIARLNADRTKYGFKSKFTEARLRKIINHIRVNGLLPVMATSKGYFTTEDPEEIRSNIRSLEDRARGILAAADGLRKFLPEHQQKTEVTVVQTLTFDFKNGPEQ